MVADAFAGVAMSPVGASGTVRGVTATGTDAAPSPATLVATIEQLYVTPLASRGTAMGATTAELPKRVICPAAVHVAVYWLMAAPPLEPGAMKLIDAD